MMQNILIITFVLGGLCLFLPEQVNESLYYHIELTRDGQFWRFITGHFVYVSWQHWVMNCLACGLFVFWFNKHISNMTILYALGFILIAISIGLLYFSQQLVWYAGFSGVLIGLYAYAASQMLGTSKTTYSILIACLCTYVAWQVSQGELIEGSLKTVSTSSYAHAFGLLGGITFAGMNVLINKLSKLS